MMVLFDLVRRESASLRREIFITAGVSGLANAVVLSTINRAALSSRQTFDARLIVTFVIAILIYVTGLRSSMNAMARISLEVVHGIRVRLSRKIQRMELETLERIGRDPILSVLTHETTTLAEAGEAMTASLQAAVLIVFAAGYVAFLSLSAFFVVLTFAAAALFALMRVRGVIHAFFRRAASAQAALLRTLDHIINGFREAKLNARVRAGLFNDLSHASREASSLKTASLSLLVRNTITARALIYLLIGTVVFVVPAAGRIRASVTTAILFLVGPLTLLATLTPQLARCNAAARAILRIEDELDRAGAGIFDLPGDAVPLAAPDVITLDAVEFRHGTAAAESAFILGPISLVLHRREMLFVVGGNGSGKSTLLKVLTGLYPARSGKILVDGVPVARAGLSAYRELFSTVFTDFHLFERVYGVLGTSAVRVDELLALMRLSHKTGFAGDHFTNRRLSTGQKKRLAMIVALLEERPVLIFDEPAADQDPPFRRFLYEELFPRLRDEGHFVVVVTHDDRYFHLADRVIRVEDGRIAGVAA